MWPWEHVAFGYLCYSLFHRAVRGEPPDDAAALVVVLAALLPDLVDKPLSWGFGLFPAGYSVAHSALVAVPVGAGVLAATRHWNRPALGVAFVVGHWSHLAGDVLYPALLGEGPGVERLLWPVVSLPAYETRLGLVERTLRYLAAYGDAALAGRLGGLVALEFGFLLAVAALWLADGVPGPGALRRVVAGE